MDSDYTGSATKLEPTAEDLERVGDDIACCTLKVLGQADELRMARTAWDTIAHMVLTAAAKAVVSDAAGNRDFNQGLLHAEAVLKALRGDK